MALPAGSRLRHDAMSELTAESKLDVGGMLAALLACPSLRAAFELQARTQRVFYRIAAEIAGGECPVSLPAADVFSIERNFFSTFFLAVTRQLVGESRFLPLYAMVNQGMRAWVTASDNILDDEYKEIFAFTFPENGRCMRSILTLLLADRVVTEFIADKYGDCAIVRDAGRVSLRALVPSALQECDEEQRPVRVLPTEEILDDIHRRKTADLFAAPLALPMAMESPAPDLGEAALTAVRAFGLACQIIDDIKDMPDDVRSGRHNLLVSILSQRRGGDSQWLEPLRATDQADWAAWERFPAAVVSAAEIAMGRFETSFDALARIGIELSAGQREAVVTCIFALLRVPRELPSAYAGAR